MNAFLRQCGKTALHLLSGPAVASALVALALTTLLYRDALTLPLFSDDLVQIPWLESISWRGLWSGPSPYGYYRPLWYSLWHVWGMLAGGLHPLGLHFLNLAAHCAAAWLVGLLAAAWIEKPGADSRGLSQVKEQSISVHLRSSASQMACFATAIFAVFPFACQAVAWPGAVYNPLVSAAAAGALLAYDRGRQRRTKRWIVLALLLAMLAPFTYEAGLLVGPLVILTEGVGWLQRRWPCRRSYWPLAFAGASVVAFVVWQAMRGAGVARFGLTFSDLHRNISYAAQGLVYPTAPLAEQLVAWRGLNPELALWLVALPTLILLAWSGQRWNKGAFGLGVLWFALFALPPLVSMEADWFALAPRFLYMTAGGVALIWTAAASAWLVRLRRAWQRTGLVLLLTLLLLPATGLVRAGMRLHRMAGESIWDAAEAVARERPVLLVNLPMVIEPSRRVYPLGFEGLVSLPARVTAEGLAYVHTGFHDAAQAVSFGLVADTPSDYTYALFGQPVGWEELAGAVRRVRAVYLTRYEPGRIHLVEAGSVVETLSAAEPLARFGERITLLDVDCACDGIGLVRLTTSWQVEAPISAGVTIFAHLLGPDDAIASQADGYPLLGMFPFWLWQPDEVVRDVRAFAIPQPGSYSVALGLYDPTNGTRLPATTAGGEPLPDQAFRTEPYMCQ